MARRGFTPYGQYDPFQYGGYGADPTGSGAMDADNRSGAQVARDRYRALGDENDGNGIFGARPNPKLNFGKAQADEARSLEARGTQTEALGLLKGAAQGNAPSEANILGNQVAGQSIDQAMAAQGGARSPAAQGAAGAGALRGMQSMQNQGIGGYAGMRSSEIGADLGAFNSGAGAIRKQDYGSQGLAQQRAEADASNELAYRDMNQRRKIGYERLAYGTQANDLANNTRFGGLIEQSYLDQKAREAQNKRDNMADAATVAKLAATTLGAVSDARAKTFLSPREVKHVMAPSALARMAKTREGARNVWEKFFGYDDKDSGESGPREDDVERIRFSDEQKGGESPGDVNEIRFSDRSPKSYSQDYVDMIAGRERIPGHQSYAAGPQKADEGYAASRAGSKSSIMNPNLGNASYDLGGGYSDGWSAKTGDAGKAPGSDDWLRYGAPGKTVKHDYTFDKQGRMLTEPSGTWVDFKHLKENPRFNGNDIIFGSDVQRMSDRDLEVMTSDPAAKQQAFLDGVSYGQGRTKDLPSYLPKQSAATSHAKKSDAVPRMDPTNQRKYVDDATADHDDAKRNIAIGAAKTAFTGIPGAAELGVRTGAAYGLTDTPPPPQNERFKLRQPTEFKRDDPTPLPYSPVEGNMREDRLREIPIPPPKNTADEDHPWGTSDQNAKTTRGEHAGMMEMRKDANRKLRGETYTYKEGFGEDPNQVHHGFMAQTLEENPITATAVRNDETGLKKVALQDAITVTADGVASLQDQVDELGAILKNRKRQRTG